MADDEGTTRINVRRRFVLTKKADVGIINKKMPHDGKSEVQYEC